MFQAIRLVRRNHGIIGSTTARETHTLASIVDSLPPAVAKFHDVVAVKGDGCFVETACGRRLLDMTSGIGTSRRTLICSLAPASDAHSRSALLCSPGVTSTGHSHPTVVDAIKKQAETLIFAQQNCLPASPASIELVEELRRVMPSTLSRFFLCNSGSEAVDNAIKVARSFTGKRNVISVSGGYHGRTYGAMSLTTSKTVYRQSFGVDPSVVASYPYCLHCPTRKAAGGMGYGVAPCVPGVGGDYASRSCCGTPLEDLHTLLKTQSHPSETAAIIVEPILGEGGFLVPPPGYLEGLRKVCTDNDMLLIFDEVQSGVGRTGSWWAHQGLTAVHPDIMIFAKGIASGFPVAGLATRHDAFDKMVPGMMGGTYGGSALACAAACGTLRAIREDDMVANARVRGAQLMKGLVELSEKYPIAEVRGRGLMVAFEFESSGLGRHAVPNPAAALVEAGFDEGLLLITAGIKETVRLLPPLCITGDEVTMALKKLDNAMNVVFART